MGPWHSCSPRERERASAFRDDGRGDDGRGDDVRDGSTFFDAIARPVTVRARSTVLACLGACVPITRGPEPIISGH